MKIEIKKLNADSVLPSYTTAGSMALDLVCPKDITILPGEVTSIHTGIAIWSGCLGYVAGLILPRSGLGTAGLVLANTVGLIDEDYQGELVVQAWNRNVSNEIELKTGDRFAQLMFVPVIKAEWKEVAEFSQTTERNTNGFGSTGQ